MKVIKTAETTQLRRDLATLLKRLRQIRREKLASEDLLRRVSTALSEAGSLAQCVNVTPSNGNAQPCCFRVNKASVQALERGADVSSCAVHPANA